MSIPTLLITRDSLECAQVLPEESSFAKQSECKEFFIGDKGQLTLDVTNGILTVLEENNYVPKNRYRILELNKVWSVDKERKPVGLTLTMSLAKKEE